MHDSQLAVVTKRDNGGIINGIIGKMFMISLFCYSREFFVVVEFYLAQNGAKALQNRTDQEYNGFFLNKVLHTSKNKVQKKINQRKKHNTKIGKIFIHNQHLQMTKIFQLKTK